MRAIFIITIFLCAIAISGCDVQTKSTIDKQNESDTPIPTVLQTSTPTEKPTMSSPNVMSGSPTPPQTASPLIHNNVTALQAIGDVLLNKKDFLSTDNNKRMFLKDIKIDDIGFNDNTVLKIGEFSVVDLDGDSVPEVVLETANGPGGYEVMRYFNGDVYGYFLVTRAMENLAKDGTFIGSSGAADNSLNKLRFFANTWDFDMLANSESGGTVIYYYVNDIPVTNEAFEQQNLFSHKSVDWYDYSNETVMKWIINRTAPLDSTSDIPLTAFSDRQKYLDHLTDLVLTNSPSYSSSYDRNNEKSEYDRALNYYNGWDMELNKIYELLSAKLSASDMKKLKDNEIQWIKTRDVRGNQAYQERSERVPQSDNSFITDYNKAIEMKNFKLGDVTKERTFYLIDLYFTYNYISKTAFEGFLDNLTVSNNMIPKISTSGISHLLSIKSPDVIKELKITDDDATASIGDERYYIPLFRCEEPDIYISFDGSPTDPISVVSQSDKPPYDITPCIGTTVFFNDNNSFCVGDDIKHFKAIFGDGEFQECSNLKGDRQAYQMKYRIDGLKVVFTSYDKNFTNYYLVSFSKK